MAGTVIRTIIISMFFSVDCAYVVGELRKQAGLRKFARITDVPSVDDVYRFLSRFDEEQFVSRLWRLEFTLHYHKTQESQNYPDRFKCDHSRFELVQKNHDQSPAFDKRF